MQRFLILFILMLLAACSSQSKEEMLQQGKQLHQQGNYQGAIVMFKNALEKDPNYLEARTELADVYLTTGSYDKAENEFQKVLHQDPSDSKILLKLAAVYIQEKKPQAALLKLDKFSSSNSETAELLTLYGRAYGSSGDLSSAENQFKKALKLEPDAVSPRLNLARVYLQRKDLTQARQLLKEVLERDNKNIQAYYLLATVESRAGQHDEAMKVYQALVSVAPKELRALYMLGLLQMDSGQLAEAQKTVDSLSSTFKDRPEGSRLKGLLLYRRGKYAEAVTAFETSLKLQQHPLSYFFLGLSYYGQNQLELALNQFQKALDLNPGFERARILVAMTLLKQKRIDDSIIEIRKVLKNNPNNAYAHNILGSAYLANGKYDEGMDELEKATEIDPNLADAHMKLGLFHLAKGESTQGEADLVKAVEAAPEVLNSRLMLVSHYLHQKNYTDAIETLRTGMNGSSTDALLENYLAAAYFAQQKPDLALKALHHAIKVNPDYFTPYFNIASYYASKSDYPKALAEYQAVLAREPKNIKALFGMAAVYALQGKKAELDKVYQRLEATGSERGFVAAAIYRIKQKDSSQALSIVNRGLGVVKDSAALLELKGGIQQQQHQLDNAETTYLQLSGIAPAKGNQLLVRLYLQSGETAKARQLVDELLKSEGDKDYPYLLASGLALNMKKPEQAVDVLQKGINLVQNKLPLQMQLAGVFSATGKGQQAEQTYQGIIEGTPRFAPAYVSLGIMNEQKGDKGKALDFYRTALKYDRNNIAALNNLAYLLTDNFGQEKEALDLALSAYRNQPNDPRIMDTLGYVLLKNKRSKDALNLLKKAYELLPDVSAVKLHLAMAQAGSGEKAAAKELLTQILSSGSAEDVKQANIILKSL